MTQNYGYRAAVIAGPRQIRIATDLDVPRPAAGQVRVRLEGCGLCGSNLPVWQGRPWFDYPLEPGRPGHEGWGTVDALGAGVSTVELGTRVAFVSERAFAEAELVPADAVVPIPSSLASVPVPGEPLACAANIVRRSALEPGQTVVIVGVGFLGALLAAMAHDAGTRVIGVSRRPFAREVARRYGAVETFDSSDPAAVGEAVRRLTAGRGAERVIEAAGLQSTLDLAATLTAERGRLVIAGYHQDGRRQVDMQLWNWKGLDVINAHERDPQVYLSGMREALDWVGRTGFDVSGLYTHRFGLSELWAAFEVMEARPDGFVKGIVSYEL